MIKKPKLLIFSVIISYAAGAIGAFATTSSIPNWYANLSKPTFNPPNWIFGPVWNVLYFLMGISLYLVLLSKNGKRKKLALKFFYSQLVLNALWSLVFFGAKEIFIALGVIILLWLLILASIISFYEINKKASYLLIPYILWVTFATVLNFAIWQLN